MPPLHWLLLLCLPCAAPLDLGARLGLAAPCRLHLLPDSVLDCPRARLPNPSPSRLHLIAVSATGLLRALLDIAPPPAAPPPDVTIKRLEERHSLESLPPAAVYRSPSACVASVLTGEPLTYFYREELEKMQLKSICNGTYPVTGERPNGEWFEADVLESSVAGGELAELSALEGSIITEHSSEPIDLPELSIPPSTQIMVVRKPTLGTITIYGRPVSIFNLEEAAQGQVVYNNFGRWGADVLLLQIWGVRFVYPIYVLHTNKNRRSIRSVDSSKQGNRNHFKSENISELLNEHRSLDLDESGLMELTNSSLQISGRAGEVLRIETKPRHGRILLRGEPTSHFTVADVLSQVVVYEHDGRETGYSTLRDRFILVSRSGSRETRLEVEVNIHPIDDSPPKVSIEGNLKVKEGGRVKLTTRQIRVEDPDTVDKDITCYVIAQPLFGQVQVADRISSKFDYSQLKNGAVTYDQSVHLGLEPREDGLSVACYDAENNTQTGNNFGIISVNIESVNDEPPSISPKTLQLHVGGEIALSQELIVPKDVDTPLDSLTIMLETLPSKGVVMRKMGSSEYQGVKNFSFREMKEVFYRSGTEAGEDSFTLSISDGTLQSKGKVRIVILKEESAPQLLINEGLEIEVGSSVFITPKILLAEDGDTPQDRVLYILRDTPLFGSLCLDGVELSPGSRFSQQAIDTSRLSYRHSDPSSSMDVFVFDLTNGRNTLFNQNFFITILSLNQTYPVVTSETAVIPPLSTLVINNDILRVKNAEDVEFHVMSPPRQGRLERRNRGDAVHTFSYTDIEDEQIQYVHLKNFTVPEIIQFEVSDGRNSIFHTLNINFTSENPHHLMSAEALVSEESSEESVTSRPVIVNNNPVYSLEKFPDGTIGAIITKRHLYAEDDGRNVTYVIADPPKYGRLFNKRTNNTCGNFTQDDLNSGRLLYILKRGARVPSDAVLLNVHGQGYPLKGLQFILEWSWAHFVSNVSRVNENATVVKVQLLRWGSLLDSAFVGVKVTGGNATNLEDYTLIEEQIQFSPGQSDAFLNVQLKDDSISEGLESVEVTLKNPYFLLVDEPSSTTIVIDDSEDEPKYIFKRVEYEVYENMTELILPVKRVGDLSKEARLECITENGEAEGGNKMDFVPQPGIPSPVKFYHGDDESFCTVVIHNDDIMEPLEDFWIKLRSRHKEHSTTHIVILPDENDYPSISFVSDSLSVHEDEGVLEVGLVVKGEREAVNASVAVIAKSLSAKANKDFVFKKSILTITPDIDKYHVRVSIIDDNQAMTYEGKETFLLQLIEPKNCTLGPRSVLTVTIEDESDVPVIQFSKENYLVSETVGDLNVEIERQGDMMGGFSAMCFAQEKTATNPDFNLSLNQTYIVIQFQPGEMKRNCTIRIIDDTLFESKEFFTVHLKADNDKIRIGSRSQVTVSIVDDEDKEIVFFRKTHYFVKEPENGKVNGSVKVHVSREGDPNQSTEVRIYTKDGTAKSGDDYVGKSADAEVAFFNLQVMKFEAGQRTFTCEVQILSDRQIEIKEYFTVHLEVLSNGESLYSRKSIVYIYDSPQPGGLMFPTPPIVFSSNELENSESVKNELTQAFPLICISVCNRRHYLQRKFESWCDKHGISDTTTKFTWQVEDQRGLPVDIPYPVFFANASWILLESIYIKGGSRVRCGATPVSDSVVGKTSYGDVVTVSRAPGACPPPSENMLGAEPFIAQISYSEDSKDEWKMVKLKISLPHYDGMFPAISTHPLGDALQLLHSYTPRPQLHKCSNIVTVNETKYGFLNYKKAQNAVKSSSELDSFRGKDAVKSSSELDSFRGKDAVKSSSELDSFRGKDAVKSSSELDSFRGKDAVNLYKHLDLESCLWKFEAYYTIEEAVNYCGASIISESNLYEGERTAVTLELPLYVSYYKYSLFGWQHTDTSTVLRLRFLYEGSVLSDEGVVRDQEEVLEGVLHPTSMHISANGSLVVFFKTKSSFPGSFLLKADEGFQSYARSIDHPEMPLTLLLMSNKTQADSEQHWILYSDFTSADYTGRYEVSLVPCVKVDSSEICTPRQNIIFPLDIHLQQISDPVLKKYTLNTTFHLIKKREAEEGMEESSMFEPGDEVYGFISMEPPQSHLEVLIEQCYVCSGRNGRTPRYNPKKKEYGCLMESPDLQYSVKILDRNKADSHYKSPQLNFNASLLRRNEDKSLSSLLNGNNVDVFYFDITPLFNLKAAKVWFVHCTFTIKSTLSERLRKRSILEEPKKNIPSKKGTNMRRLFLQEVPENPKKNFKTFSELSRPEVPSSRTHISQDQVHLLWLLSVLFVLFVSLILTIILLCYIVHVKKELSSKKKTNFNNINYRECLTNDFNY